MRTCYLFPVIMCLPFTSCFVERTVTDSRGNVIYQEPEMRTPFEDEAKREKEVAEKERELGWR